MQALWTTQDKCTDSETRETVPHFELGVAELILTAGGQAIPIMTVRRAADPTDQPT